MFISAHNKVKMEIFFGFASQFLVDIIFIFFPLFFLLVGMQSVERWIEKGKHFTAITLSSLNSEQAVYLPV